MAYKNKAKQRATQIEYAKSHKKEMDATKKEWFLNNKSNVSIANKKWRENNPDKLKKIKTSLKSRLMNTKHNAKVRGLEWDLHFENFADKPLICFYTGFKLTLKTGCFNTISFDRVNNNIGYIDDNVVFCCDMVNTMKSNLNMACFKAICKAVSQKS